MLWHDLEETSATLIAGVARSTLEACATRSPGRETTFRLPSNRTQVENAEQEAALANGGEVLLKATGSAATPGRTCP
jgi:hypothetical protein